MNGKLDESHFQIIQTTGKPLLLLRPLPRHAEGFAGYLTRLCSENKLNGPAALARRLGLSYGQLVLLGTDVFREILCGRAKIAALQSEAQRPSLSGRGAFQNGICSYTRLCPQCMKEGLGYTSEWGWPLTLACTQHGTLLLDVCPRCHGRVTLLRHDQYACECGYDFRMFSAAEAPKWLPLFYRVFSPLRAAGNADDREIVRTEYQALLILRGILLPEDKPLDARSRRAAGASKALLQMDKIGLLGQVLCDWPNKFHRRMHLLYGAAKLPTQELLKRMQRFGSPELSTASTAVRAAIANKRREERQQHSAVNAGIHSIEELKRITGLNRRTIIRLIRTNKIHATVRTSAARQRSYEIPAEEARRIRQLYSSSIGLRQASAHLGCSETHVNMFARADAFPATKITTYVKTWRFEAEALDRFLSSLEMKATENGSDVEMDSDLVPLGHLAVKTVSGMPVPSWVRVAQRILANKIPLFKLRSGRALSSIAIRRTDTPPAPRSQ